MNTITRRVIAVIPVTSGKITQEPKNVKEKPYQNISEPGHQNYILTKGRIPLYETSLEMYNKGRVVIIIRKK